MGQAAWPVEWLFDAALRGVLLALLLLLAGVQLRDRPRSPNGLLAIAMPLGLCVQVIASTPLVEAELPLRWAAPAIAVSLGNAVVFWLFVRSLVDDGFVVGWPHVAIWGVVVGFVGLNFGVLVGTGSPAEPLLMRIHRGIPLFFGALCAVAASRHWRDDLVERRRQLRVFVVFAGIAYIALTMVARSRALHGRLSNTGATLDVAFLLLIVGVIATRMLRLTAWELFAPPPLAASAPLRGPTPLGAPAPPAGPFPPGAPAPLRGAPFDGPRPAGGLASSSTREPEASVPVPLAPPDPAEQRLAEALDHAMTVERAYRTEDLTVSVLAARLAVPEYRLRRLINQRLGHRNFNAYVNGFRLAQARAALADPAQRELPILTIALDAGFQSIGPFNRAFKAETGLTPGDFRREKLADS